VDARVTVIVASIDTVKSIDTEERMRAPFPAVVALVAGGRVTLDPARCRPIAEGLLR